MKEKELKSILDRSNSLSDAIKVYQEHIELLTDIVNYGSNLIVRTLDSSKKKITDYIIIGVLLKQVVQMIDAVQVLLSVGSIHPAHLQTRAAFESYLYMAWIMKENSERRAKFYYVSGIRKQRSFALRLTSNTKERGEYEKVYKDFAETIKAIDNSVGDKAREELDKFNDFLKKPGWKEINDTFESFRQRKHPYWFEPLGVNSIAVLASQVDESPAYDLYYTKSSEIMHAGSYRDHIQTISDKVFLIPIRNLNDADNVIHFSCHVSIGSYIKVLTKYRFGELSQFWKKYLNDWQRLFNNVPKVNYKTN